MKADTNPETATLEYDDVADANNLAGIANGDPEAFQRLHQRYGGLLFAAIHRILGDVSDSEEVLQEVADAIWRKAHLYHAGRGRPVTWLTAIARNRAIDRLRARKRKAKAEEHFLLASDFVPRGTSPTTGSEAAVRREACAAVRTAVLELTPIQREAIEMVFFDGLTQRQAACELGEPLGTVKARIRRGLASLRRSIEKS
jgi:RNA polymerase sigma-70 factor (ECF subfamily)